MTSRGKGNEPILILASNNCKKAQEMRSLLPDGIRIILAGEAGVTLPEETGETFEANALLKARAAAQQSGYPAIADDSGLVVDALDGRPGVRSARFAADHDEGSTDEDNNRLLLKKLEHIPEPQRTARFVAAVAVVIPNGEERVFVGSVEGVIGHQQQGSGGFGYDPLFFPEGRDVTMAELPPDEKHAISHRGRAFRKAAATISQMVRS